MSSLSSWREALLAEIKNVSTTTCCHKPKAMEPTWTVPGKPDHNVLSSIRRNLPKEQYAFCNIAPLHVDHPNTWVEVAAKIKFGENFQMAERSLPLVYTNPVEVISVQKETTKRKLSDGFGDAKAKKQKQLSLHDMGVSSDKVLRDSSSDTMDTSSNGEPPISAPQDERLNRKRRHSSTSNSETPSDQKRPNSRTHNQKDPNLRTTTGESSHQNDSNSPNKGSSENLPTLHRDPDDSNWCQVCQKVVKDIELKEHMENIHTTASKCSICRLIIYPPRLLHKHVWKKHKVDKKLARNHMMIIDTSKLPFTTVPLDFACNYCTGETFEKFEVFRAHVKEKHKCDDYLKFCKAPEAMLTESKTIEVLNAKMKCVDLVVPLSPNKKRSPNFCRVCDWETLDLQEHDRDVHTFAYQCKLCIGPGQRPIFYRPHVAICHMKKKHTHIQQIRDLKEHFVTIKSSGSPLRPNAAGRVKCIECNAYFFNLSVHLKKHVSMECKTCNLYIANVSDLVPHASKNHGITFSEELMNYQKGTTGETEKLFEKWYRPVPKQVVPPEPFYNQLPITIQHFVIANSKPIQTFPVTPTPKSPVKLPPPPPLDLTPFCQICKEKMKDLDEHNAYYHEQARKCKECKKFFYHELSARFHMEREHPDHPSFRSFFRLHSTAEEPAPRRLLDSICDICDEKCESMSEHIIKEHVEKNKFSSKSGPNSTPNDDESTTNLNNSNVNPAQTETNKENLSPRSSKAGKQTDLKSTEQMTDQGNNPPVSDNDGNTKDKVTKQSGQKHSVQITDQSVVQKNQVVPQEKVAKQTETKSKRQVSIDKSCEKSDQKNLTQETDIETVNAPSSTLAIKSEPVTPTKVKSEPTWSKEGCWDMALYQPKRQIKIELTPLTLTHINKGTTDFDDQHRFKCNTCSAVYPGDEIVAHLSVHKIVNNYHFWITPVEADEVLPKCDHCSHNFVNYADSILHMEKHGFLYKCDICDYQFQEINEKKRSHFRKFHSEIADIFAHVVICGFSPKEVLTIKEEMS